MMMMMMMMRGHVHWNAFSVMLEQDIRTTNARETPRRGLRLRQRHREHRSQTKCECGDAVDRDDSASTATMCVAHPPCPFHAHLNKLSYTSPRGTSNECRRRARRERLWMHIIDVVASHAFGAHLAYTDPGYTYDPRMCECCLVLRRCWTFICHDYEFSTCVLRCGVVSVSPART